MSPELTLSFACRRYDRTEAILDGKVRPEGILLVPSLGVRPSEIFWRMLTSEEFDCSEMSLAYFISVKTAALRDWPGIPAFTARHFFHTDVLVNSHSGIKEPADLERKKVGLPEYQMSAAVWSRGVLHDEYNVRPENIHWYVGRGRDLSKERATSMSPPENVDITLLDNVDLLEALEKGELDAVLVNVSNPNRSGGKVRNDNPNVKTLFDDPQGEAIRYYKKTGIFPINHMVVLKTSIALEHPWAATNIFNAFQKSKEIGYERWRELENWEKIPSLVFLADAWREQRLIFGDDAFTYGLGNNSNNWKTIQTMVRYLREQQFIRDETEVEKLFDQSTLQI